MTIWGSIYTDAEGSKFKAHPFFFLYNKLDSGYTNLLGKYTQGTWEWIVLIFHSRLPDWQNFKVKSIAYGTSEGQHLLNLKFRS